MEDLEYLLIKEHLSHWNPGCYNLAHNLLMSDKEFDQKFPAPEETEERIQ